MPAPIRRPCSNIFVGHGLQMKLGDLGMARFVSPSRVPGGGAAGPPALARLTPNTFGTVQVGSVAAPFAPLLPCELLPCEPGHLWGLWWPSHRKALGSHRPEMCVQALALHRRDRSPAPWHHAVRRP